MPLGPSDSRDDGAAVPLRPCDVVGSDADPLGVGVLQHPIESFELQRELVKMRNGHDVAAAIVVRERVLETAERTARRSRLCHASESPPRLRPATKPSIRYVAPPSLTAAAPSRAATNGGTNPGARREMCAMTRAVLSATPRASVNTCALIRCST